MAGNFKHKNTDLTLVTDQNDLDLIRQYTESYNKAYAEGDKAGQQAAHDAAERIREKYDYSGGTSGSDYIKLGTGARPAKADTSWLDKLGDSNYNYDQSGKISAKLDALLNRTPFSYDAASDPLYQQYRKQYTREADRSAEDVLGKAAVMTGGMPSTAAVTASQQASDYQMSQMTDKIPELQQLAYSMYQDKLSGDRADLNTLIGLEDNNYNRWLSNRDYLYQLARDQVGDQQTADALAYQKQQDKLNYDYQKERDAIEDARYDAEWQYKLQQAAQQAARRNTRVSTTPTGGGEADYDGLFAAAQASGYPKSFISNNYKKYGFSSSSSLYDDYESWLEGQGGGSGSGSSGKTLPQGQFIALLSGFNTSLKNGEGERILSTLDKAWPLMTSDQKAEMQKLLTQYGYSYEEG
jgi:hypothetical protein